MKLTMRSLGIFVRSAATSPGSLRALRPAIRLSPEGRMKVRGNVFGLAKLLFDG